MKATQTLHAQLSLNRDRGCQAHVNQRPFSFCHFHRENFASVLSRSLFPVFSSVELPQWLVLIRKA